MNRFVTLAALTLLTVTLVACSNTPTSPSSPSTSAAAQFTVTGEGSGTGGRISALADIVLTSSDRSFVDFAARAHQGLVQSGMLAEGRVAHPRVKWFAQQMEQENRKGLARLRELASSAVPQNIVLTAEHQQIMTDLSSTTGNPLDRVYTAAMQTELAAILVQFQQAANASGSARELREYAADFAGRLTSYIELLREIAARVR